MYRVYFSSVLVSVLDDPLKACGLALNLHQFSNVPHRVHVFNEGKKEDILNIVVPSENSSRENSNGNKS